MTLPGAPSRPFRALAIALAGLVVVAGLVVPAQSASAVTYVACGDIDSPSGLVAQIERGNLYGGGVVTIYLTPGCTYELTEPAWDYDIYGNKIYTESGFWKLNETRGRDNVLVVEGNGATITRSATAGRFRLFDIGERGEVVLKNLTLTGGQSLHGQDDGYQHSANAGHAGGAIYNAGTLVLDNVTVTGNTTGNGENGDNGGSGSGDPAANGGQGGGIYNAGTLTVRNSTFSGNTTGNGGAGGNGAINGGQGGSGGNGAAIFTTGTLAISTSTFTGNSTGYAGSAGGGFYGGPPGYRGSGGAIAGVGNVTITQSLLLNNNAEGTMAAVGGAVAMTGGQLAIENSTVVGNKAWRGGAIYLSAATGAIRSSTFTGNDATGTGDQITGDVAAMDRGATLTFANTLLVDNDPTQVDCNTQVWTPAVTYSSLGGLMSTENSGCGTNTVIADAQLGALADWGGPTQSRLPATTSPALGAGVASQCLPVDQRGTARPATGCAIGAVERLGAPTGAITGSGTASVGTATTFGATASVGGGPVEYRWTVTGVTATISSATAASPQITFTSHGQASVALNIRPVGASDSESVDLSPLTVVVAPAANRAPQVSWVGPAITSANEGDTSRFSYTVSDADGDAWTLLPGSPSCGTGGSLVASGTDATGGYVDCSFPNGPATTPVAVQVQDVWLVTTTLQTTVSIAEVAPTIAVTTVAQADEGSSVTVSYEVHEPGTDTFTPLTTCTGASSTKIAGTDVYTSGLHDTAGSYQCRVGNGPSTVTATVTANGGTGTATLQSRNVAPSVAITGPNPAAENAGSAGTHRYLLNATDPADAANLVLVAGSASCGGPGVGTVVSATLTAIECRFSTAPSSPVVSAVVEDQDGARSTGGSLTVSTTNVAPTVTITPAAASVNEGADAFYSVSATDPGLDTLSISVQPSCAVESESRPAAGRLTAIVSCVFADGPATGTVTVTVSDGKTTSSASVDQLVANVAPSVAAEFLGAMTWEYSTTTLRLGTISDPGADTATSIIIHWGDGETDTVAWPPTQTDVTHSYINSGDYFPTIDVIDEDGTHLNRGSSLKQVVGVTQPAIALTVPPVIYENRATTFHFAGPAGSSGVYSVVSASCGFDDLGREIVGTNIVTTISGGSFDCTYPIGLRTEQVRLQVRDPSGTLSGLSTATLFVSVIPATIEWLSGPAAVYEDPSAVHRFEFFSEDDGPLPVLLLFYKMGPGLNLAFGCGPLGTVVSTVNFEPSPVFNSATGMGYIDCTFSKGPGASTVEVATTDSLSSTTARFDVTVLNTAPTVELSAPAGPFVEGQSVDFTFTAGDLGGQTVTASAIDCGPEGSLLRQAARSFSCSFDDGPALHTVTLTVTDGTDSATDSLQVFVDNAAPTAVAVSGSAVFELNQTYTLTIGETTDAGADTVTHWTVHWGDGSTSVHTSLSPQPTHVYTATGPYAITVDVTDEDGTYPALGSLSVINADHEPPVLTVPDDVTMEGNGTEGLYWAWPRSAIDERDGDRPITCTGPTIYGYDYFYIGTTTYHCTASDLAGNTASAQFTVTVVDTTAPVFAVPSAVRISATSASGATVSWNTTATDAVDWRIGGTCDYPSGSLFAIGSHTVHCTATDRAGNTGTLDYSFEVGDFSAPAITLGSGDLTVAAVDASGAVASYAASTAWDALDGDRPVTCAPASGSVFPLGDTIVTCSADDAAGNVGTADFLVRVSDTSAPVLTVPADFTAAPTSADGAVVTWTATAADNVTALVTATCTPASGDLLPIGLTVVECEATDDAGNRGTAEFTVSVQDAQAPVITVPADVVVEATGPDPQEVAYDPVTATDLVDGPVAVTCDILSESDFALGTTRVTCEATDSEGNVGTASFTVTVADTTAPVVTAPADVSAEATGVTTVVTYGAATATDLVDGSVAATCSPASVSAFGLGHTTVTCAATDAAGNVGSAVLTVEVVDTTAPTISQDDLVVGAADPAGAVVTYAPVGVDLVDGTVAVSCLPVSGSAFASESTTTVDCAATDGHGNAATGSFTVTVSGALLSADLAAGGLEAEITADVFAPGDYVVIAPGTPFEEVRLVTELGSIIFGAPVTRAHLTGTPVRVIAAPLGDTTAPTITASVPATVRIGTAASVTASCADAGVGVEQCVIPAVDSSRTGTFTVTVTAWDRNGNTSTRALQYTVTSATGLAATGVEALPLALLIAVLLGLAGFVLVRRRRSA
jgi:large repetitive protein